MSLMCRIPIASLSSPVRLLITAALGTCPSPAIMRTLESDLTKSSVDAIVSNPKTSLAIQIARMSISGYSGRPVLDFLDSLIDDGTIELTVSMYDLNSSSFCVGEEKKHPEKRSEE